MGLDYISLPVLWSICKCFGIIQMKCDLRFAKYFIVMWKRRLSGI